MNIKAHVAALKAFALKHYEGGGHWVYETFEREDYEQYLAKANWDLGVAKWDLHDYWQLMEMQKRECAGE